MRRHLGTLILGGLIGMLVLSRGAQAGHKQNCATSQPSEQTATEQGATSQEQCPPKEKCPPKKCCQFQIFPKHKSCFDWPEKVVPPCIVPPCPAPPAPCPPIVYFPPPPPPNWELAPRGNAPTSNAPECNPPASKPPASNGHSCPSCGKQHS